VGLQNPPAFPSGADLRLYMRTPAEGKAMYLPCGENNKKELILSLPLKFKILNWFKKFLKNF
jgi:hypothetical protein